MKITNERSEVVRIGAAQESNFTIKATAKAFQILSSGLYSNKIEAIVRELSCNAYDAHRAAGKGDVPIEITAPTAFNPTFIVKDYGIGLSHADVIHVYTTYFESTKADSDEFIGALGLGSKSPFSYSSQFTVESRWNGTKNIYSMFLNEEGVPSVSMLGSVETDEPNGVTVQIAVKPVDVSNFVAAIKSQLCYFTPLPVIVGNVVEIEPIEHSIKNEGWGIRTRGNGHQHRYRDGTYVVQGVVAYPLDLDQVDFDWRMDLDLFVPVGAVSVAASREALSYDKTTIANLNKTLAGIKRKIYDEVQATINTADSYIGACQLYSSLRSNNTRTSQVFGGRLSYYIPDLFRSFGAWKYKGKDVTDQMEFDVAGLDLANTKVTLHCATESYSNAASSYVVTIDKGDSWLPSRSLPDDAIRFQKTRKAKMHCYPTLKVYINDSNGKGLARMRAHVRSTKTISGSNYGAIWYLQPVDGAKSNIDEADVKKFLDLVPGIEVIRTSTLPDPVSTVGIVKKTIEDIYVWKGFKMESGWYNRNKPRRTFSTVCWNRQKADTSQPAYYVVTHQTNITNGKKLSDTNCVVVNYFDVLLATAKRMKWIPETATIIGITVEQAEKFDLSQWTNFLDLCVKNVKTMQTVVDTITMRDAFDRNQLPHLDWVARAATTSKTAIKDPEVVELLKAKVAVESAMQATNLDPETIGMLTATFTSLGADLKANPKSNTGALTKNWQKAMNRYPLMEFLGRAAQSGNEKHATLVVEYMNDCYQRVVSLHDSNS